MESSDLKRVVEELKSDWKRLWRERIDDRFRAEGVADKDYSSLFVERGTVILATRNFKLLSFEDVLEQNGIGDKARFVSPDPRVGGWGKFIRGTIVSKKSSGRVRRAASYQVERKGHQCLRKGGRGWLHSK